MYVNLPSQPFLQYHSYFVSFFKVPKVLNHNVQVAFIIVDENNGGLTDNDVETLTQSASAIQLASRIIDTPCNEMHTDGYATV